MSADPLAACPCTSAATVTIEWECRHDHKGYAALCQDHGAIHVAALLSGDIRCGRCRQDNREALVFLRRVNGKTMNPRLGRTVL
jgi:hypothetical protein